MRFFRSLLLLALAAILPACGAGGGGTLTPTVAPAAPTGLSSKIGNGRVTLSWTPSPAAKTYQLQHAPNPGGPYVDVPGAASLTATSFTVTGLSNGIPGYYVVCAVNPFGVSPPSSEVPATPGFLVRLIAPGEHHTLAILQDDKPWAWGSNQSIQLGGGTSGSLSNVAVEIPTLPSARSLASGTNHSLAVDLNGLVWAWGNGAYGQLGTGISTGSDVPLQVPGLTGAVAVAAGDRHSIALLNDGTIQEWGIPWIADGPYQYTPIPLVGLDRVVAVSALSSHALALRDDGTVWGWGWGAYGMLGNGDSSNTRYPPLQIANINDVVAVSSGQFHSLFLRKDGTVWGCGDNSKKQLGLAGTTAALTVTQIPGLTGVTAIAAGSDHSLAVQSDTSVAAWGSNFFGQVGIGAAGPFATVDSPTTIPNFTGIDFVAASLTDSFAVSLNGSLWAWGSDFTSELGGGTGAIQPVPIDVPNMTDVLSVHGGTVHSGALRTNHTVWAWGEGSHGELGTGAPASSLYRVQVPNITDATALGGGGTFSVAVRAGGIVWTWGQYDNLTKFMSPTQLANVSGATAVAGRGQHGMALASGTVWNWGSNFFGEFGNNSGTIFSMTPVQASGLSGVTAIDAGYQFAIALQGYDVGSTVWVWGSNQAGQMGNAGPNSKVPTAVPGLTNVIAVAAGFIQGVALKSDGSVWTWGGSNWGELGTGVVSSSFQPPTKVTLPDIVGIAAGLYHCLALDTQGRMWAWGRNQNGQLGDGTTLDRSTPVLVTAVPGVASVSCGDNCSFALMADKTIRAWGLNDYGQMGIGTSRLVPSPILITR